MATSNPDTPPAVTAKNRNTDSIATASVDYIGHAPLNSIGGGGVSDGQRTLVVVHFNDMCGSVGASVCVLQGLTCFVAVAPVLIVCVCVCVCVCACVRTFAAIRMKHAHRSHVVVWNAHSLLSIAAEMRQRWTGHRLPWSSSLVTASALAHVSDGDASTN